MDPLYVGPPQPYRHGSTGTCPMPGCMRCFIVGDYCSRDQDCITKNALQTRPPYAAGLMKATATPSLLQGGLGAGAGYADQPVPETTADRQETD